MANSVADKLNRIQIPGTQNKELKQTPASTLFPDLQIQDAYEIQAVSRDGSAAPVIPLSADKLKDQVVELEFENGQKLWVSGDRLLEKLGEAKQREEVISKRSGGVGMTGPSDEVRLPTVWQTPGASRSITGQLILKGLKFIGFDPASTLAKGVKDIGVQHIENQLAEGNLNAKLAELNNGTAFDQISGECSGWLFPFTEEAKPDVSQQIKEAKQLNSSEPYLLFLHGTASSSNGSFGKLAGTAEWKQMRADYGSRMLAFEHRSLSASPIKNVIDLIALLPDGARLHFVSHSRGGLLGELLCLGQVVKREDIQINDLLDAFDKGEDNSSASIDARIHQREMLERLWEALGRKQFRIERFVRVACPARGTTWLADNLDYFFSALLHSVELVPGLAQNPIYDFIKASMTALVQLRKQPAELPGLEAMMPASPTIAFLNHPSLTTAAGLAVIRGDSNIGGSIGSSILTLLTNTVLWEKNDWVVNTRAMDGGMKRAQAAYQFLDEGSDVSHFNYFFNADTRSRLAIALKDPLTPLTEQPKGFEKISRGVRETIDVQAARSAFAQGQEQGTVFVLPGIMGSELQADGKDIWLHYIALLRGGMDQLAINAGAREVKPTGLMASDYKRLVEQLSRCYRVEPFAYDWRNSVKDAGEKLGMAVQAALANTDKPVYLLAHSMGGLVARSMIASRSDLWQQVGKRQGRLIMLGTPNDGAPAIARMLLGEEKLLKQLALLDLRHSRAELLQIIRDFPGVLDLLPKDYLAEQAWQALNAPVPNKAKLEAASLWRAQLDKAVDPARMIYVAGYAERTPLRLQLNGDVLEVVETNQGDGRVPYEKYGKLADVPTYYADVIHGDLADEPSIFPAIFDLLEQGKTDRLPRQPRTARGMAALEITSRAQEIEPTYPTETDLYEALTGGRSQPSSGAAESAYTLQLSVMHGHLRYAKNPVAVGHYIGDAIVSAESVLDKSLNRRLKARHSLNVYPGAVGTADVIYASQQMPPGALVIGLGEVGEINADIVKRGVTAAALRYALLSVDRPLRADEKGFRSAAFSTLLIGTYGGHALTVAESIEAIVAGTVQANRMLQAQGLWNDVRIDKIEFVEIYEDVAIQAMQTVQGLREHPPADFGDQINIEVVPNLLNSQRGGRYQRPATLSSSDWWRRIQIVGASQNKETVNGSGGFPDLLKHLSANPALLAAQRDLIEKLVNDAMRSPEQRAYLASLISHLLTGEKNQGSHDDLLEFTVLTDRARAEGQQQAVQRDLIDRLIQQSVSDTSFHSELATTLFELLVPNDLKQQNEHVSLVLDNTSAQYPWELLAERSQPDRPVVTQIGMLRQFKALDFRANPKRSRGRNAFVVGDTAGHNFGSLPGAQAEANQVATALKTSQYDVHSLIKPAELQFVTELFAREYQILHIAAHGTYEIGNEKRQGIVLGKDQYLTTTELVKLRAVPDLVFINCCHLGKLDTQAASDKGRLNTPYPHRLAASIAEELIKIGVKAVVAAGWAVDDHAALTFATEFYRQMLDGTRYGEAVLQARQKTYQLHKDTNTWGAYQCYGHPAFTLDLDNKKGWGSGSLNFYSRREYRDEIKSIAEQPEANDPTQNVWLVERVKKLQGGLPNELKDGEMLADLANAWRELGQFEEATKLYETAVTNSDARASLRSVEQLANLLCRMVDRQWYDAEAIGGVLEAAKQQERLEQLGKASQRLQWLISTFAVTAERLSLHARVHKSLALIETSPERSQQALAEASRLYQAASEEGVKNGGPRDNYPTINWLTCHWLLHDAQQVAPSLAKKGKAKAATETVEATPASTDVPFEQLLNECVAAAQAKLAVKDDFWTRIAIADAALMRNLLKGDLLAQKDAIMAAYQKEFDAGARPAEVDTVLSQIDFIRTMLARQAKTDEQKAIVSTLLEIKVSLLASVTAVR